MSFLNSEDVPAFTLAGFTLNVEERATLFASLAIKKDQEKLPSIHLWGKILGINQDYLLAQSVSATSLFERKYYYTLDNLNWYQLPEVTPEERRQADSIQGRFFGDPSYEHTVPKNHEDPESSETKMREEKRLAATISSINYDVEIVPRGAYYRDLNRVVRKNPSFQGTPHLLAERCSRLPKEDFGQTHCYMHFRDGFEVTTRTLTERINKFDDAIDIFESIENDEPKGVWSVQAEVGGTVAIVRSLQWPGHTFIHSASPLRFTSFYFGTGQKNHNIGFML
ncbi:hypothetical protein HK105_202455 [Polyrhizophydium stewartii]|uniref:Radial spoke head protein 9 homolog n=1 Tax=Polyrhizophydium stewartii TaxID=2732419 RepID=A0ABR4NET7_9FUNG